MTSIKNPSSLHPYTISFTLGYDDSTLSSPFSSTLTATNLTISLISFIGYNNTVGNTSNVTWLINFNYYFDKTTIL
jgi:hypothetical protein